MNIRTLRSYAVRRTLFPPTTPKSALQRLGYAPEKGFRDALARWIGTENFEERDVPGKIDPLVLDHLRKQVGAVHA